jgi:hypothetical protein
VATQYALRSAAASISSKRSFRLRERAPSWKTIDGCEAGFGLNQSRQQALAAEHGRQKAKVLLQGRGGREGGAQFDLFEKAHGANSLARPLGTRFGTEMSIGPKFCIFFFVPPSYPNRRLMRGDNGMAPEKAFQKERLGRTAEAL